MEGQQLCYTMPVLQAFGRTFKITVEVNGAAKEEFVKDGQTWIGVEPGEAFQVKVEAEADSNPVPEVFHRLQLALDGQNTYWFRFNPRNVPTPTWVMTCSVTALKSGHTSSASPARRRAATARTC